MLDQYETATGGIKCALREKKFQETRALKLKRAGLEYTPTGRAKLSWEPYCRRIHFSVEGKTVLRAKLSV